MISLSDVFSETGLLSQRLPGYEYREGQLTMAEAVLNSLTYQKPLAVQAGTGLGKTFAYLVPALMYAIEQDKRIVVSTATLQLQNQLIRKDLPAMEEIFRDKIEFKSALVKGRNNYLCIRKLTAFAQVNLQTPLFRDPLDAPIWEKLLDLFYSETLVQGDKDEIPFRVPETLWTEVGAEAELCMRGRCPFYHDCYFYRARAKQKEANVLITNHALFFADLAVRRENGYQDEMDSVLSNYDGVIFDEAQNTEDYATDHFSSDFSYGRVLHLVISLRHALRPGGILQWPDEQDFLRINGLLEMIIRRSSDFLLQLASQWNERTHRILNSQPIQEQISPDVLLLCQELKSLTEIAQSEEQKMILQGYTLRAQLCADELIQCCSLSQPLEYAYWFENPQSGDIRTMRLACAPVSLAELMIEGLFTRIPVVMTSATLASELLGRMGMVHPDFLRLDSPFDYQHHSRLYIPMDGPDPVATMQTEFFDFAAEKILELVYISQGRAFILCTSYQSMDEIYSRCYQKLTEWNFLTMKQGDYRREEIIQNFSKDGHAVLFAVASFWEGVDIQGDALSLVVLVKLPFAVPTEPILQARMEALQREGKDPFRYFSVPQASLRLKQGFGRLIRSNTDRGVIAILDKRILTKTYGKRFLKDLPPTPIVHSIEDVISFFHETMTITNVNPRRAAKKITTVSSFDIDEDHQRKIRKGKKRV